MARAPLTGVAGLLVACLLLPLWSTRMEAPQYRGEEALRVAVYAGRVVGDIDEIEILNQYVGVHLPLDTPELTASPWVLGALLLGALVCLALRRRVRRLAAVALGATMLVVMVGGGALLQYRLYQMGHERSPEIMTGVPDFTPPLLGAKKIANFTATMSLGAGGWTYLAALALIGWSLWAAPGARRRGAEAAGDDPTVGPRRADEATVSGPRALRHAVPGSVR